MGPGGAGRHQGGERVEHRVAALAVEVLEDLDLALPVLGREVLDDHHLVERRRAQHGRLAGEHQLLADGVRRQHPADPQPGGERLAERAEVEHVLLVTARPDRRRRRRRRSRAGRRGCPRAPAARPSCRSRGPRRGGRRTATCRPGCGSSGSCRGTSRLAGRLDGGDRLPQRLGDQPVGVHRHVHDLGLVGREGPERADVRRRLGDDHVAGVAEDPGHQVERLLGADGDDHVVRGADDALERHDLADLLAQDRVALAGAVLQRLGAAGGEQVRQQLADRVERQCGRVGHAAGEADDLRAAGHREQRPDLRRRHAGGARGVAVGEGIERHPWHDPTVPGSSGGSLFLSRASPYAGPVVTSPRLSAFGLAGLGLLLGAAFGWLAGLLRAPRR